MYFKFKLFDDVLFNKNKDFYINTYKFVQSETNPKHFIKTINENFEGLVVLDKKYKNIVVIDDNLYLVSCIDVDNYIGVQFTIFSDNDNSDKNIPNTLYIHKNIESLFCIPETSKILKMKHSSTGKKKSLSPSKDLLLYFCFY